MNFGKWTELAKAIHSARKKSFYKTPRGEKTRMKLSKIAKRRRSIRGYAIGNGPV